MKKEKPKYIIKTIVTASNILDYFIEKNKPITLTEISERWNLYPSTVHRILDTLNYLNYVDQLPDSGYYQLGLKALELGLTKLSEISFVKEAEPILTELSMKFNENVYIGTLFEGMVLYLAKFEAVQKIRIDTHLGTIAYFNSTALGKILLAFLPKDEREKIYRKVGFHKNTKNTIINKNRFEEEIDKVKKQGFAIDNEENEEDIQCIAAPIRDHLGKVIAATSISGPSYRFCVEKQTKMKLDIIKYAQDISIRLGYKI
jgi:IclR family transcriptional regulator, KDG regulon repressor